MPPLDAGDHIGRRAARGGVSLFAGEAATRLAGVAGLLFLASVLSPADFGAVAVATLVIGALSTPFGLGLGSVLQALEQSRDIDRTALFLAMALGCMATALAFLAAPLVTAALGAPDATQYVRALAPTVLFARWAEVRFAMIERRMSFAPAAAMNAISTVLGVVVAIVAAFMGAGAWALVLQLLTTQGSMALGATLIGAGEKRPQLHIKQLGPLWHYLRPVMGNSILIFIYVNVDDAVVAKATGSVGLGLYSFAYRISNFPTYVFTRTVNRVMLPTYRALAERNQDWAGPFQNIVRILALASGAILFGALVHGPSALTYMYGDRWSASYPVLRVLALYGLFRTVGATTGAVFLASGRPWLVRQITQWQTVAMLLLLFPAVFSFGITGAAVAVTLPLAVATIHALCVASRIVGTSPKITVRDLLVTWSVTAGANVVASLPVLMIDGLTGLAVGAASVAVLVTAYCMLSLRQELAILGKLVRRVPLT